jgi:hypothetical protein
LNDDRAFTAAWHRWERANLHYMELGEVWNRYIASHPFDYELSHQGGGTYILRVWETEPMPADFAVEMGEWLYNLRETLDYIIWALAAYTAGSVPPPKEEALQYPIYDDAGTWKRNFWRIKELSPRHQEMLLQMQPFNSDPDANYLGWINRLARIDSHRSLVNGTSRLVELEPVFEIKGGRGKHNFTPELQWGDRVLRDGRADAARITIFPWDETVQVQCNPRVGIDPEVAEWSASKFWGPMRFTERLKLLQTWVAAEIAIYEYECTGASRKEHLLAESFRKDSDDRRPTASLSWPTRHETIWSAPAAGSQSSKERLHGEDFPSGPHPVRKRHTTDSCESQR